MRLQSIVDRIVQRCPEFKTIGGAWQLQEAMRTLPITPGAFVLPASEVGGENPFLNQIVEQRISSSYAVVLAVKNTSGKRGDKALDDLTPLRRSVREALLKWPPEADDGESDPMGFEFENGALNDFKDGVLWWTDTYRTAYTVRSI